MLCPHCTTERLVMADRQGIEIDYCPNCRGVWLDRGELDKLIERSALATWSPPPAAAPTSYPQPTSQSAPSPRSEPRQDDDRRWRDDDDTPAHGYGQKKKKKSFLSDILDF